MHSVTDGRTDGQTDGQQAAANSRSYCVAVRSAKKPDDTDCRLQFVMPLCALMTCANARTSYSRPNT